MGVCGIREIAAIAVGRLRRVGEPNGMSGRPNNGFNRNRHSIIVSGDVRMARMASHGVWEVDDRVSGLGRFKSGSALGMRAVVEGHASKKV